MDEKFLFNRDLSLLSFSARVLQEARDEQVPALERLKFLGIFQANLEVFITERFLPLLTISREVENEEVKSRHEKMAGKLHKKLTKQFKQAYRIFSENIIPSLAEKGVQLLHPDDFTGEQTAFAGKFFADKIKPIVNPFFITSDTETVLLENDRGYLLADVKFHNEGGVALIEIPAESLGRFIEMPSAEGLVCLAFVDDIIRMNLEDFFPGHTITGCYAIQQISGAEFFAVDELKDALLEIKKQKRKRDKGAFSFLLYEKNLPEELNEKLRTLLGTHTDACIENGRYTNLKDFLKFPKQKNTELYYPPFNPLPVKLPGARSIIDAVKEKDRLLYFPYNSYDCVLYFLQQAATDASVQKIAITLYRVANNSKVIAALLTAARNKKEVFVFQEVKASENEASNILYARELEAAGAKVVRNYPGLKVHGKLILITRKEESEKMVNYAYIGTGNFNEKTSESYADISLLTRDERITKEVKSIFDSLEQKSSIIPVFEHLLVAPFNLKKQLIELIDREISFANKGEKTEIIFKLNNLEDKEVITKLYEASHAGVKVAIIVRSICCLIPGKKKLSANISAISIIDRFLEHGRIYSFHNGGSAEVFFGSADMMSRNLNKRIEVLAPVYDKDIKENLLNFLNIQLSDNVKARVIDKKQKNKYREPGDCLIRSQEVVYEWLVKKNS